MTKDELVQILAKKTSLNKSQILECLNAALEEITKTLSSGKEVIFTGFGRFEVRERKEREGINPKTGEKIRIPAAKVPKFRPGRILKDAVK
jgi:nucleoid DNA-binding protein